MRKQYNALLVYPRARSGPGAVYTESGYFSYSPVTPLGLITIAALFPKNWNIKLVDTNLRSLEDEEILWADYVFTGGMIIHREDVRSIVRRCHSLQRRVVLGGPDVTDSADLYAEADHIVLGEAEVVFENLIGNLENGVHGFTYGKLEERADISKTPIPRYDLLEPKRYSGGSLQLSRGCPFQCEFCSVPALSGNTQRVKSSAQVVAELEALRKAGFAGFVNIIDDNLIGNKRLMKPVLEAIAEWNEQNNAPFFYYVMATFNVAADDSLLELLAKARIRGIFIGIETTSIDILKKMKKFQNLRKSFLESIRRIQSYGILVTCGFILGNDGEGKDTLKNILQLIEEGCLDVSATSILTAFAHTPLIERMKKQNRLLWKVDEIDLEESHSEFGMNFIPDRDRKEILHDYLELIARITSPALFFRQTRLFAKRLGPLYGSHLIKNEKPFRKRLGSAVRVLASLSLKRGEIFWISATLVWYTVFYPRRLALFWSRLFNYFHRRETYALNRKGAKELIRHIENSSLDSYWHKKWAVPKEAKAPLKLSPVFS